MPAPCMAGHMLSLLNGTCAAAACLARAHPFPDQQAVLLYIKENMVLFIKGEDVSSESAHTLYYPVHN